MHRSDFARKVWNPSRSFDPRQAEKIDKDLISPHRQNRLRVKLHPVDRPAAMGHRHDHAITRRSRGLQFRRQRIAVDHQRVVPPYRHRLRKTLEQAISVVSNLARTAMNWEGTANDFRPECLADRLMTKANTEHRDLIRKSLDHIQATARFVRRAWPRRQDNSLRFQLADRSQINRVVADDKRFMSQATHVPRQVVDETIEVVDE